MAIYLRIFNHHQNMKFNAKFLSQGDRDRERKREKEMERNRDEDRKSERGVK